MLTNIVLTVISEDKPGIVEAIANTVNSHHGNWLESRLAQLAGKFAGVISVSVSPENQQDLTKALDALKAQGINIVIDEQIGSDQPSPEGAPAYFSAAGPDRKGIVKEISQAFASRNINLQSLETELSSMPYSGEPLFQAEGNISLPEGVDLQDLSDTLDEIADNLGLDFSLHTQE